MIRTTERYRETRRWRSAPLVDVWRPAGPGPHPSVLVVHGGGYVSGWRGMSAVVHLARALVARGYAVAAPEYRLLGRGGQLDAALDDVRDAARWWAARGEGASILGLSAGGALALLAAEELPFRSVVSIYGVTDFARLPHAPWLLGTLRREVWEARSPSRRAGPSVPTAVLQGDADRMVVPDHAHALVAARRARGLPVRLHVYPGAGHGFLREPANPAFLPALAHVTAFLDEQHRQP